MKISILLFESVEKTKSALVKEFYTMTQGTNSLTFQRRRKNRGWSFIISIEKSPNFNRVNEPDQWRNIKTNCGEK